MDDFLTARQVQNILRVDRITVYRMLKDGRLKGLKIGQQWRFARQDVERLINRAISQSESARSETGNGFPTHCIQTIQDLFSDVSGISALVIDVNGEPVTNISHPCAFCQNIMQSLSGQKACRDFWKELARQKPEENALVTCHAGLQYITAPIQVEEELISYFLAGEIYWQQPDLGEESERISQLAMDNNLKAASLQQTARTIPVIEPHRQARVMSWPAQAAKAMQSILRERTGFMERLKQIANLTQLS